MNRILCISDIHGQINKFNELLNKIKYNPSEDTLILLGDYVDRGFQNIETLYKIIELRDNGAIVLKGNHDYLAEKSLEDFIESRFTQKTLDHLYCDGVNTNNELKKLNQNQQMYLYNFLRSLPYIYEIDDYIFVHAGINARKQLYLNTIDDFIWSRWEFIDSPVYKDKTVIFGHTPTLNMQELPIIWHDNIFKDKIGIDCGSIFGGKLGCLELPSKKEYYV